MTDTVHLLKQKEKVAMNSLYDEYSGPLFGLITRIVKDRGLAEELLHDTFVRAWEKIDLFDQSKGSIFTWLMQIARNLSINAIRSKTVRRSKQTTELEVDQLDVKSKGNTIPVHTIGIKGHLASLDQKCKEAIEHVYFNGSTHQEAADDLNIPLGTLKSRVQKGIKELRKLYHL